MITVLLVDDHELVRAGIKQILQEAGSFKIIGEVSNGEDAIAFARQKHPQVVLMDVKMPGIGGLEATRRLLRVDPDIKVIALTAHGEEPFPSRLLQAGAAGYITKGSPVDEMVNAIKSVFAGKRHLSPTVAQQLALKHLTADKNPFDSLSEREMQVMLMIVTGQKVPDIADKLCLSPKTVNSYRYRLFEKLKVNNDVELTHKAILHDIIDTEEVSTAT